jgi:hypothetical protein
VELIRVRATIKSGAKRIDRFRSPERYVLTASDLPSGSFTESTGGSCISSSVLQCGVVDVGQLAISDGGSTFGELAGLELHLGVVEFGDIPYVPCGEDGLGEQIEDTVEDCRRVRSGKPGRAFVQQDSLISPSGEMTLAPSARPQAMGYRAQRKDK